MKYKNEEFKNVELKISEEMDSQIFALNKKNERLKQLTKKFFQNEKKLKVEDVKDAFVTETDPSVLMEKHKNFIKEYKKELNEINQISNFQPKEDYGRNTDIQNFLNEQKHIIKNTINDLDKQYLWDTKRELLNEIVELYKDKKNKETMEKRELMIATSFEKLKEYQQNTSFIDLKSLNNDLANLKNLYELVESEKIKSEKWISIVSVTSIAILTISTIVGIILSLI